jgi:hypothetical protein
MANGIEQFTRCGWGAGAMYGIFGEGLGIPKK